MILTGKLPSRINSVPPISGSRPNEVLQHFTLSVRARPGPVRNGAGFLAGGGQQGALVALAPAAGARRLRGDRAPVVGEPSVPGGGRLGHDRVGPVVVGDQGRGHGGAAGAREPARGEEDPEPVERASLAAVG